MRLYYVNHDCLFAVEQTMMMLFPDQRPEYSPGPPELIENTAIVTVAYEEEQLMVHTVLRKNGETWTGMRTAALAGDEMERRRTLQHTVRLSFYDAGTACLGYELPWGALSGVRPVKLPTRDMLNGMTREEAIERLINYYRVSPRRARLALDCAQATLQARASLAPDEISLYISIPFCPTRCSYCSFIAADVKGAAKLVAPYLDALCQEIRVAGAVLRETGRKVKTIYMGGGTPTTLSSSQLDRLMAEIATSMDLSHCVEYTVEAGRPDTITREKLAVIRKWGGNRVSVNPQTMDDRVLEAVGRSHTAGQIRAAWEAVKESGISVTNMDLIAGLPQDSLEGFCSSLDQIISMGPENITVHTLALKKSAALFQDRASLLGADQVVAMLDYAWKQLHANGYVPYYLYRQKYMSGALENVGWSLPGTENLYNICMMEELHPVFSLGAGGVTKLTQGDGYLKRLNNPKYPKDYLSAFEAVLADKKKVGEYFRSILAD